MSQMGTVRRSAPKGRRKLPSPYSEGGEEMSLLPVMKGEQISVVNYDNTSEWCICRNERGQVGYVLASQLDLEPSVTGSEGSIGSLDDSVSVASHSTMESASDHGGSIDGQEKKIFYKVLYNYQDPCELSLVVEASELVQKIPAKLKDQDGRVFVESCRTGCRGFVPMTYMERATGLDIVPWFVGPMTRDEAEEVLESEREDTFLVRLSDNTVEGFVLSMKTVCPVRGVMMRHRKIKRRGGMYTIWSNSSFKSVEELIQYHNSPDNDHFLKFPFSKCSLFRRRGATGRRPPASGRQQTQPRPSPEPRSDFLPNRPPPLRNKSTPFEEPPATVNDYNPTQAYVYSPVTDLFTKDRREPPPPPEGVPPPRPPTEPQWPIPVDEVVNAAGTSEPENTSSGSGANHDKWYVSPDSVQKLNKLGAGHYGEVFKAKYSILDGNVMAMKTLNPKTMRVQDFMNEVNAMKELRHPYLVKLYGVCPDEGEIFMLMEFYPNGSIIDYFKVSHLAEKQKQNIARSVASGMCYLSEQNYIHRDLAARNVLLADDLSPRVADFGLAKHTMGNDQQQCDLKMPWKWTAPEALKDSKQWSVKCDVWSFGIFCWEMYTHCKEKVYKDITRSSVLMGKLKEGYRMDRPPDCPPATFEIIKRCWDLDPDTRISFKELETLLVVKKGRH